MFKFTIHLLFTLLIVNLLKSQPTPQLIIEYGDGGQCRFAEKEGNNLNYMEVTPTLYYLRSFMIPLILLFDSKENLFWTTSDDIYGKCSGLGNPTVFPRGTPNFRNLSRFNYDVTQKFCQIIFNNGNEYNLYKLGKNIFGRDSDTMFFDEQNGTFTILSHPEKYEISDDLKVEWENCRKYAKKVNQVNYEKSTADHSEASTSNSEKPSKKPKRKLLEKFKKLLGGNNF